MRLRSSSVFSGETGQPSTKQNPYLSYNRLTSDRKERMNTCDFTGPLSYPFIMGHYLIVGNRWCFFWVGSVPVYGARDVRQWRPRETNLHEPRVELFNWSRRRALYRKSRTWPMSDNPIPGISTYMSIITPCNSSQMSSTCRGRH